MRRDEKRREETRRDEKRRKGEGKRIFKDKPLY